MVEFSHVDGTCAPHLGVGDSPEQAVEIFPVISPVLPPAVQAPALHCAFSHS